MRTCDDGGRVSMRTQTAGTLFACGIPPRRLRSSTDDPATSAPPLPTALRCAAEVDVPRFRACTPRRCDAGRSSTAADIPSFFCDALDQHHHDSNRIRECVRRRPWTSVLAHSDTVREETRSSSVERRRCGNWRGGPVETRLDRRLLRVTGHESVLDARKRKEDGCLE